MVEDYALCQGAKRLSKEKLARKIYLGKLGCDVSDIGEEGDARCEIAQTV